MLKSLSSLQRPFDGYAVGVFEVTAHRNAVCYPGYAHGAVFEDLQKVMSGCLPLTARVGSYYNFTDIFFA